MNRTAVSIVALLIPACATTSLPPVVYYEAPSEGDTATIVGEDSFNSIVPVLFDNNTIFVERVDGRPVRDPRSTGKAPLKIAAGKRYVGVAQALGSFYGSTYFEVNIEPGKAYRVRYQQDLEGMNLLTRPMGQAGGPTFFWIEEADSGHRVTEQTRVTVTSNYRSTYIPIFIKK
jgi:hypothetical protein